ncbi:hypothetical protein DEJ36_02260 [Curtobacterium sp. MCPF17_052]|nr:hypothetical protein [Curtobacterium sp. MCPF17_052]WIB12886.1 hypothetical protein DEJ36_02260 [Curtobacterium sp. MCPF17_052]
MPPGTRPSWTQASPGAVRVQVDASDAAAEGDDDDAVPDLVHDRRGQAGDPTEERHEGGARRR